MKKLYCTHCGRQIPIKCGMIPNKCNCGVEFIENDDSHPQKVTRNLLLECLFMLPLFILLAFCRSLLQDSIVLFTIALIALIVNLRIAETILILAGMKTMTNIERR